MDEIRNLKWEARHYSLFFPFSRCLRFGVFHFQNGYWATGRSVKQQVDKGTHKQWCIGWFRDKTTGKQKNIYTGKRRDGIWVSQTICHPESQAECKKKGIPAKSEEVYDKREKTRKLYPAETKRLIGQKFCCPLARTLVLESQIIENVFFFRGGNQLFGWAKSGWRMSQRGAK